ncbi:hypothetical protein [Aestuariivirga sp.]|uniref:hypothetical protein n=1 Tax=Aestuariivirga sp. TaxID=2650926 RepID=UPI0039E53062
MRKKLLSVMVTAMSVTGFAAPVLAHDCGRFCRPYLVETACNEANLRCRSYMHYVPGQNLALSPPPSYWYGIPRWHADSYVYSEKKVWKRRVSATAPAVKDTSKVIVKKPVAAVAHKHSPYGPWCLDQDHLHVETTY